MQHEEWFDIINQHIHVSRETFSKLVLYHDLLYRWQSSINLISPSTLSDSWNRHFLDSLQLLKYVSRETFRLLDLGSGAGFPGMVLAIAGKCEAHLVESDSKKYVFLKEVARVTNTSITIHQKRIEETLLANTDIITARGCSDLATLLQFSLPNVSRETFCLFPKGENYSTEIAEAEKTWRFTCEVYPSITHPKAGILKISNLQRR